ncbi:MAG: 16S rRNA (cytosine(1402)-N(4))-methyltransferase [Parcubacteria group bacterium CG11_big_fil_rev_8_21_14_0_20_39_14]|nr:MAG: 16S rRNA (cytosine(1402)-N(4))-methyltransferase [Parcubacteria group bacterium CG11_big_fil_rev_8_21_14_0_20_39_14]PIS35445.1 MAG: 16S rRNA (cytosine(1402)-N(4))-methyltransferase [Parcubacteria group bacterium CG08_land_8_20_14_0_20_38_56]
MSHIPVLQKEVLEYLAPRPNENFIDCTIGGGGHSAAISERIAPGGKILGIEWDFELYKKLAAKIKNKKQEIKNNLILVCDNFANLEKIVKKHNFKPVQGILFDLGLSSWHLEESERGFSFLKDEPLIMRYCWKQETQDPKSKIQPQPISNGLGCPAPNNKRLGQNFKELLTAEKIINEWSESDIERILREYGEERFTKKIAQKIVEQRRINRIKSTFQLVEIIKKAVPQWYCRQKRHPATKTFQALRIAANHELENLKQALLQALDILEPKGRIAVISFHSLEDRIVKSFFKEKKREGLLNILTKKPIIPTLKEISSNPRSRSAKLRVAVKTN